MTTGANGAEGVSGAIGAGGAHGANEGKGPSGRVFLIGAGPGDPGLLTLKGKDCLQAADVVVYDRLASDVLLGYAREGAELIYVGKESSHHALPQDKINDLLAERAATGHTVARLKGGDPFIFGRGGEEGEYLRSRGVPFEVVPGVTSAIAGPAYAGIPLTHRGVASSLAIVTGHEDPTKDESALRWDRLATATDTLVFLMGMENLDTIAQKLIEHGRPANTPVALVRWGTTVDQETLVGELGSIAEKAVTAGFGSPAVIVVGEVVRLRPVLEWAEERPLFGRRVVVTRSRAQASGLSRRIAAAGGEAVEFPAIRIVPPESYDGLDAALTRFGRGGVGAASAPNDSVGLYDWVVFTSANGVAAVVERLLALGLDVRAFAGAKLAAIGEETARALGCYGLRVDLVPGEFVAEGLLAAFGGEEAVRGRRILLARAAEARPVLPDTLRSWGATVDEVAAYRTVADSGNAAQLREQLEAGSIDAVTFASSTTVRNFCRALEEAAGKGAAARLLGRTAVFCIGPVTAETAKAHGLAVAATATRYTIEGLMAALTRFFAAGESGA